VYLGLGQQQDVGEEVDVELFLLLPRQHVDETAPASIDDDEEGGGWWVVGWLVIGGGEEVIVVWPAGERTATGDGIGPFART
jgi:hypothetical protein